MQPSGRLTLLSTLSAVSDTDDGSRVLGRGKPVALLAYLSASPGRRASRERLATLLWSEGSSEQARQNLRQALWYLRRRLGDWFTASDDFVQLALFVESDRDRFLLAVREQRLGDAIVEYGGAFIPEFAAPGAAEFEEWAEIERRRLRSVFVGCCDTLARQSLGAGQFSTAVELAKRARDEAPLELATWRLLLESLVAARDSVSCLAEVGHLEAMLSAGELEPDQATKSLLRSARAVGSGGSTTSVSTPRAEGATANGESPTDSAWVAPDLIGRESEFRALLERWEAAKEGRGSAVLVCGAAGLGKSRLLADVHARLRASRARALLIRANPGDRAVGGGFLAAFCEVLAQRPGARAVASESASVLVALAPALSSAFPQAKPDAASGEDAVRRRVGAILDLLRAVSDESALALFIDDLHWVDPESRRVLDAVTARIEGGRVLVVVASRPPLEVLGGFASLPKHDLPRFDAQRIAEFVTRLGELPADTWAVDLPADLLATTQGIPLTLIEALQRLIETGALTLTAHRWSSPNPARIGEVLREGMVLEARLRSLGSGARELLVLLATIGRPVGLEQLLKAAKTEGGTEPEVEDGRLLELEHRGFATRQQGTVSVAHDEIAAAALVSASAADLKAAHEQSVTVLMSGPQSNAVLKLAVEHALRAEDLTAARGIVRLWIRRQREAGDDAAATRLLAELTGENLPAPVQRELMRTVPLWERPTRGVVRLAALALAAVVGTTAWSATRSEPPADIEVIVRTEEAQPRYLRVNLSAFEAWEPDEPIVAQEVNRGEIPAALDTIPNLLLRAFPDGSGWHGASTLPNKLGGEVMLVDQAGRVTLPMPYDGDDIGGDASPDGRFLVVGSARWHPDTDRMNIGILDRSSGRLTRLIASNDYDGEVLWSPDGSRVAFKRMSFTAAVPVRVCVASVDAAAVRCVWPELEGRNAQPIMWLDDEHLLVRAEGATLALLSTTDATMTTVGSVGDLTALSPLMWQYSAPDALGARQLRLVRAQGRVISRPVLFRGAPIRAVPVMIRAHKRPPFVDRVRVVRPSGGVAVDQSWQLRLDALDAEGRTLRAHAVRFWSLDDSVATVVDGLLRPRRLGRVRIVGTVGGWRSDTATIDIVASSARDVLRERWTDDWQTRWRPYGEPRPRVGDGDGGPALNPNGNGKYPSGAYFLRELPADSGLGVEVRVSIPLTPLFQWQTLSFEFLEGLPLSKLRGWDHTTNAFPIPVAVACALALGGEGASSRVMVGLTGGSAEHASVPTPRGLYAGGWHTLRVQIFPDGRCGLAIDGKVLVLTSSARALAAPVVFNLHGHSVETEILAGRLELWTGVRGGVDWNVVASVKTP